MMRGMTDVHQHLLWGIDDGPKDAKTMHQMLLAAQEQNVRRVFATPHANPGFQPFDLGLYQQRLSEAREFCRANGLDVDVRSGAEIAWTFNAVNAIRQGRIPTLGDTDLVLIEFWPNVPFDKVEEAVEQLIAEGLSPLLAHVERYRSFVLSPKRAMRLRERTGVAYQVNAGAVLGGCGMLTKRFLGRMLSEQAIDAVASDAHNCTSRPQLMGKAYAALAAGYGKEYADALVNFAEVLS